MSKRPYEDVKDVYTGGMGSRRRAVAREMENLGMGSPLGSPMPEDIGPPYHSQLRPGIEALDVSAPATGMSLSHFESSPTVGAASSIDAAMQDDTASGRDTAPVPDRGTASRQDAAPVPNRDTASGQDELETQPGSAHDGPPSKSRRMDNGEEDADQGVEMPCDPHSFSAVECRAMPRTMPRGAFFQNVIMPWID